MTSYVTANRATPILNTPDFSRVFGGEDGMSMPLDKGMHVRELEMIAFPQTKFQVIQKLGEHILKVSTQEYPGEYYIDDRFVQPADALTPERVKQIPSSGWILRGLKVLKTLKTRYFWGGNWPGGVSKMLEYYPPKRISADMVLEHRLYDWTLMGVDCSGMTYYATQGALGRNTGDLLKEGTALSFEKGLLPEQIAERLKPLDLIIWNGHVVVVYTKGRTIESLEGKGIVITPLIERVSALLAEKTLVNVWNHEDKTTPRFMIRRWHPEFV